MKLQRIISGGQTGADRAALDAAIALGIAYGGWCPKGGRAEDYPTPPGLLLHYPFLKEAVSPVPATRTTLNVKDATATLILSSGDMASSPGTELTLRTAEELGRPVFIVRPRDSAKAARDFIKTHAAGGILNVAGPRESEVKGTYGWALQVMNALLAPA